MGKASSYTKEEIIRGIRNKQNHVILWLYEQILPILEIYVGKMGGSSSDAKDLFQEAMIVVFQKIRKEAFEPRKNIPEYIVGICKKMWFDRLSEKQKTLNIEFLEEKDDQLGDEMLVDPEPVNPEEIKRALYLRHITALKKECREILYMVRQGITLEEISRLYGYPDARIIYNKKAYCLQKLIERIKNDPEYPL
ncbi:MAG: sigma-70 family RNA polymerase sigma factor [Bacteroidales bacterium]|nr:sigma-70 family RNA polymerase sigma factor [Bacteroidales bacterium]